MILPRTSSEPHITIEDIATYPTPGNAIPVALTLRPDDHDGDIAAVCLAHAPETFNFFQKYTDAG